VIGRGRAAVFRLIGVGWYIGICVAGGAFGGRWLGQRLDGSGTEAILTIVGLFLGLIIAFYGTYRMLREATED
jgi:hypothetical protein